MIFGLSISVQIGKSSVKSSSTLLLPEFNLIELRLNHDVRVSIETVQLPRDEHLVECVVFFFFWRLFLLHKVLYFLFVYFLFLTSYRKHADLFSDRFCHFRFRAWFESENGKIRKNEKKKQRYRGREIYIYMLFTILTFFRIHRHKYCKLYIL